MTKEEYINKMNEDHEWRAEAWEMMHIRSDVVFLLLTKRPERIH